MNNFDDFEQSLKNQDRSPVTINGYLYDLGYFSRWLGNDQNSSLPGGLTIQNLQAFRQLLLDSGSKPQTINRKLAALAAYGHWALQQGLIPTNPAASIKSIEQSALAPKWLDKNQRHALLRAVERDLLTARERYPRLWIIRLRDAVVITVLLNTGLRVGEVCQLRLSDVKLGERSGSLVVRSGKGSKQRVVPLRGKVRNALQEWLRHRPQSQHDLLFTGQRGTGMTSAAVQHAVARAAKAAGIAAVTPHILRHSFAKGLIDAGADMREVASLLGHNDLKTTLIYTIPGEKDLEQLVEKLE